jgi:hypothetical protein
LKKSVNAVSVDDRWLKASVIGSTWGSFEIITGSFLHNLKVPFAGTIMAFFSILLMTAFLQHWRQKGIIWRAGLIAALMKSLSPSAFLLGPMTGIFLEALFVELTISILGINFISCVLGGGLSLLTALIHKLVNLLLLYGGDFITIYKNIISFAFRQFDEAGISMGHVLTAIALLYFISGMLAGGLGYFAGKSITHSLAEFIPVSVPASIKASKSIPSEKRSILLLAAHLLIIPVLMYLNYTVNWYVSLSAILLYVSLLTILYPIVLRRLKKPVLWLQLAFILLMSILFLGSYTREAGFNTSGIISGLRMNLRALLVIAGFAAIGFELRNDKIRGFLIAVSTPRIYQSLRISFNLLPEFIHLMNSPRVFVRHPFNSLKQMLTNAEIHFNQLQNSSKNQIN